MNRIRIAVDQSVGAKRKAKLMALGYDIVVTADHSEPDESWMNRAFAMGAQFAVSPDLDIPRIIENSRYPMAWINFPLDKLKPEELVDFIHQSIQFKLRFYGDFTSKPAVKAKESGSWLTRFIESFGSKKVA